MLLFFYSHDWSNRIFRGRVPLTSNLTSNRCQMNRVVTFPTISGEKKAPKIMSLPTYAKCLRKKGASFILELSFYLPHV